MSKDGLCEGADESYDFDKNSVKLTARKPSICFFKELFYRFSNR